MLITVKRLSHNDEATLSDVLLDGQRFCYGLEDQPQDGPKVMNETRIPAGTYQIKLRMTGSVHQKCLPTQLLDIMHVEELPYCGFGDLPHGVPRQRVHQDDLLGHLVGREVVPSEAA